MRKSAIFLICVALLHLVNLDKSVAFSVEDDEEWIVRINHGGGANGQKIIDLLFDNGIRSLEHPRLDTSFVDAYIRKSDAIVLQQLGIEFERLPNPSQEMHRRVMEEEQSTSSSSQKRSASLTTWDKYHNYVDLTNYLAAVQQTYPTIARRFSIGKSVQGRELWGIRITKNPDIEEVEPEVKYIGNMHGDETVGREMLLRFIDQLCSGYMNGDDRITKLIENTDIYIIPSMNPDGFNYGRRSNYNYYDINRNFPDLRFPGRETGPLQPETLAVMNFTSNHHFVLSANFHGGAVVVNYPFDGNANQRSGVIERTPDHDLFVRLSNVYSQAHRTMHNSNEFNNGITNGAEWYVLYGGMQDWNYLAAGCMEVTIELSNTKYPAANYLADYWEDNKNALLSYLEQVHTGVKGTVVSAGNLFLQHI